MTVVPAPHRESERRFLLQRLPDIPYARRLHLRQFYTARDTARGYAVRFRLIEDQGTGETSCIETHKIGGGLDVMETEYPVPTALYADLRRVYGAGREIVKTRHVIGVGGASWEIDLFDGDYAGLVVAECELAALDQPCAVPEAFGPHVEVTHWRGMKNVSLCFDGLTAELKERLRAWYGREVWRV